MPGFGIEIPERDRAIFASQNIFLPDDAFVEIFAEIDQSLVAVADVFAVDDPLLGAVLGNE